MRSPPVVGQYRRVANPSEDGSTPTPVAPYLMPVRSFDAACALVIDYLAQVAPMGLWR